MAEKPEIRLDDLGVDEVVAKNAYVHLERMDTNAFALIVESGGHRVCVWLHGAHLSAYVSWEEKADDT